MRPLVSIIIPCYNAEAYIAAAIKSGLRQTYSPVEVIVVNDGSTDGSLEVIKSFGNAVRYETGPNRGGCVARNVGLNVARGEFIQFLDADDFLHPEKIEIQLKAISAMEHDSIVFCDWFLNLASGNTIIQTRKDILGDPVCAVLDGPIDTAAPIHRKEVLQSVGGFTPGLKGAQEFSLHMRLALAGYKFHHFPETLYTKRIINGSVSSHYVRTMKCAASVVNEAYEALFLANALNSTRTASIARYLANAARGCIRHGGDEEGKLMMLRAREINQKAALSAYSTPARMLALSLGISQVERLVMAKRTALKQISCFLGRKMR